MKSARVASITTGTFEQKLLFYRYLTCRILEFLSVKLKGFDAAFLTNFVSLLAIELNVI